jgi:hypothetical protein
MRHFGRVVATLAVLALIVAVAWGWLSAMEEFEGQPAPDPTAKTVQFPPPAPTVQAIEASSILAEFGQNPQQAEQRWDGKQITVRSRCITASVMEYGQSVDLEARYDAGGIGCTFGYDEGNTLPESTLFTLSDARSVTIEGRFVYVPSGAGHPASFAMEMCRLVSVEK